MFFEFGELCRGHVTLLLQDCQGLPGRKARIAGFGAGLTGLGFGDCATGVRLLDTRQQISDGTPSHPVEDDLRRIAHPIDRKRCGAAILPG